MRRPRGLMGYANRALANVIVWGAIIIFAFYYWQIALGVAMLWIAYLLTIGRRRCDMCRATLSRVTHQVQLRDDRMAVCPLCYDQLHRQKSKIAVQEYVQNGRR